MFKLNTSWYHIQRSTAAICLSKLVVKSCCFEASLWVVSLFKSVVKLYLWFPLSIFMKFCYLFFAISPLFLYYYMTPGSELILISHKLHSSQYSNKKIKRKRKRSLINVHFLKKGGYINVFSSLPLFLSLSLSGHQVGRNGVGDWSFFLCKAFPPPFPMQQ